MPLRLLQDNPKFGAELYCDVLGQRLPPYTEIHPGSEAITRLDRPAKEDCDGVEVFYEGGKPVFALVFEMQRKPDDDKYYVWPDYLISIRTRLRCPVALVVICPNERTAKWAQAPIETGHLAFTLAPFVIDPGNIPIITDPEEIRGVEQMGMLSGMAHGDGDQAEVVIRALYAALSQLPEDQHVKYTRIARAAFSRKAFERLEALTMADTSARGAFIYDAIEARGEARGEAKGEAKGIAEMLLLILEQRGIALDDADRERITSCTDLEQLQYWATRAFQVDSVERLFA
ncbi:hypothetical protein GCM10028833_28800 [Glycomyces tarimensis]